MVSCLVGESHLQGLIEINDYGILKQKEHLNIPVVYHYQYTSFSRRQFYQIKDETDSEYHHLVGSGFGLFK